jgi:hypothetical protein
MNFNYYTSLLLSASILIPSIIGVFRYNQISFVYRPFIYLLWIGCLAEFLEAYFAYAYHNNVAVGIIYRLCESLILLWFFNKLGIFNNYKIILHFLTTLFITIWLVDVFFRSSISNFTFYFDIAYALVIVLLSIGVINNLLFVEKDLLRNAAFLICMGLIIFFTYQIIQRMFGLFGLRDSIDFRRSVQRILSIINCFTNLIYAVAVVWMRKRQPFKFQF